MAVASASPRKHFHRRRVAVGHRAKDQRRDKRRQRGRGERERLDGVQPVRVEHGAQRHEPHAHRRSLNEEQRHQFRILSPSDKEGGKVRLNAALAKAYAREFRQLAKSLKLADPVTLELLARSPGVLQTDEPVTDADDFWPAVEKATQIALAALVKMREREGTHLAQDLKARMAVVRQSVARVQKQAPQVAKRYQEQLRERIKSAGLEVPGLEDERLLKEVIYFADRSDISEEVTRLQSHFQQFEDCLKSKEPVGRTLDFLSQEMNREINTIGAKANDSLISREVVVLKAELEKFREQAQNVE